MRKIKNQRLYCFILSIAALLAMSCGAWAATASLDAYGTPISHTGDLSTTANEAYGAWARTRRTGPSGAYVYTPGSIDLTGDITTTETSSHGAYAVGNTTTGSYISVVGDIATEGWGAIGARAELYSWIDVIGNINTSGDAARGVEAVSYSTVQVSGDITTEGDAAHGAYTKNGTVIVSGDIETLSRDAYGVYSDGPSGNVYVYGDVTTHGTNAYGVFANDRGHLLMSGDITTYGNGSYGAVATGGTPGDRASSIDLTGSVTTHGSGTHGIYVRAASVNGAFINMVGSVTTTSDDSHGAFVANDFKLSASYGTINLSGDITTSGNNSYGAYAYNTATATSDSRIYLSSDVTTTGSGSHGLYAHGVTLADSAVIDAVGKVETHGEAAYGVYALSKASVDVVGDVATTGDGSIGVYASGDAKVSVTGNVTTTGDNASSLPYYAHGVYATTGANVGVTGDVATVGNHAHALYAIGNANINQDGRAHTEGNNAYGAFANNDSIIIRSGDIWTEGLGAYGAWAYNGSSLDTTGSILTQGSSAHALLAEDGGYIRQEGSIRTEHGSSYGLYALEDSVIVLSGDIKTEGSGSSGAQVSHRSSLDMTGSIWTLDDGSSGLEVYVDSYASQDGWIHTMGEAAFGAYAAENSFIVRSGDILTEGLYAYGVVAFDNASVDNTGLIRTLSDEAVGVFAGERSLVVHAGDITTSGENAHGVHAFDNSRVTLHGDNDAYVTSGTGSYALYATGSSSIDMTGDKTIAVDTTKTDFAVVAEDGSITGSGVYDVFGGLLASGDGAIDFAWDDGTVFVGYTAMSGTNAALDIQMDGANSVWFATQDSALNTLELTGRAALDYSASALGTTVTVDDLAGDGHFIMKTDIAAQAGDKLVVEGTSDGGHTITVANQGSAQVTGKERVTLVETADTGSSFSLTNGTVELGVWHYYLTNVGDGAGGQDWVLYGGGSSDPDADPTVTNVASSAVNTFIGNYLLAYAENDTLTQRLGDLRHETRAGQSGVWFRAFGGKFESDARKFVKAFDMDHWGVQVGYDRKLENSWFKNGSTYAGVYFGYGKGDMDFEEIGYGTGDVDHKTLGIYASHMADSGFYFDAIARYLWSETKFSARNSAGEMVSADDIDSGGLGLSFEAGKRIKFGEAGKNGGRWYAEPQAQLTWQRFGSATYLASNGLRIGVDSYDSLIGRVGFLLGYESARTNVYAKVSYLKEFSAELDIHANGSGVHREDLDDDWFVYGVGVTHRVNDRNALYLDIQRSSGGDFEQQWRLNGGWRFTF